MIESASAKIPRVSLGMPVYNDVDLVASAIASLQAQTFPDFELIVSDNASTDGTAEVCRALAAQDSRIRYIRHEWTTGQAGNFEFVFSEARGEFFAWVCSDDRWDERFLERLIGTLEKHPGAVGAFGPFVITNHEGQIVEERDFDYGHSSALARLYGLCWHWDDGHEYGLFRRARMAGLSFPRWWWPNRPSPYEISYPVLFFLLARGPIISTPGSPLLLKRARGGGFHYQAGGDERIQWYLAKLLLSLNLGFVTAFWTRRGSHTIGVAAGILPGIAARIAVLVAAPLPGVFRYALRATCIALVGERGFQKLRRSLLGR